MVFLQSKKCLSMGLFDGIGGNRLKVVECMGFSYDNIFLSLVYSVN